MPMHRVHRMRHRRQRGRGIMDFLGKANTFLKNSKLISSVGSALGNAGVPYAGDIGAAAGAFGYGRRLTRRRHHGRGLSLAGMGHRRRR